MRGMILSAACAAVFLTGCTSNKQAAAPTADAEVCHKPIEAAIVEPAKVEAPKAAEPAQVAKYGVAPKLSNAEAVPAAKVLADPAAYDGKYIRMTGLVSDVCSKRGCWLKVSADGKPGKDVFIKLYEPSEGFLVQPAAKGHEVTVEGIVRNAQISEAAARHFKEDGGATPEELEKIKGPQPQIVLTGTARGETPFVQIVGVEQGK